MKLIDEQRQTFTKDLGANLKLLVENELIQLLEILATFQAEKRLLMLLKLLSFVLLKVVSVSMTKGEPFTWEL